MNHFNSTNHFHHLINLFITKDLYSNKYISNLISKYSFIHLYIVDDDMDIYNKIIDNHLIYSNTIIFHNLLNISENLLININNLNGNFYILNNLKYNEHIYSNFVDKLNKYSIHYPNIKYIDYNLHNILILQTIFYPIYILYPQIILDNNYYNKIYDKIYDIIVFNKNDLDVNKIDLHSNHLDLKINYLDHLDNDINKTYFFKHKILIISNISEHEFIEYETIIQECIYNKVIIIYLKNNLQLYMKNHIFKDYIFIISHDILSNTIHNILNNYDNFHNNIFNKKFDNLIVEKETNHTISKILDNNKYGFIILRSVNSELTNHYWKNCYKCIRKYYNNKIVIIDDNSDLNYLKEDDITLSNCKIIFSEFHKRGEILPYYYMHKLKLFKKAVIIHDSVFINQWIDFFKYEHVKFLWHFTHHWDNDKEISFFLNNIENNKNLNHLFFSKNKWMGCFGVQSVIDIDFLNKIQKKYNIFKLLEYIDTREKRMNFERVFALIATLENNVLTLEPSIYGIIHHYIHWGYTYENYINDYNNNNINHLDLIKVWSGR
jgi:hypothetical protein